VTLTTYSILRLDAAVLSGRTWDAVVLDEAQFIKNPESQVARAAFGLKANFRLALSGTPLENRLEELWSLMHYTNPGLLGGRRQFDERVARPLADGQTAAAEQLRRRLRPFILRRLKRDVALHAEPLDARLAFDFLLANDELAIGGVCQQRQRDCDDRPLKTLHRSSLVDGS
jgi:SNF2 family DNA or RNA helicase